MSDELNLPDFDPRTTRRAVRRGLVKTAMIVLAGLLAAVLVLVVAPTLFQMRGDRDQRMQDVLGTAFKLYNPAYKIDVESCCDATPWSLGFRVNAWPIRAMGGYSLNGGDLHTITQNFFGKVNHLPMGNRANTTLTTALSLVGRDPVDKNDARETLARLPQDLRALAVVEFVQPMTSGQLKAYTSCPDKVVYEQQPGSVPITWGATTWDRAQVSDPSVCDTTLEELRAWSAMLRDYDDANLRSFGLTLARVRKAAKDGLVYAYVDSTAKIAQLRKLVDDPKVKTIRLADVNFDIVRY